jgi:hypothetical protein
VFVRKAVAEKLARENSPEWQPKTGFGRKLWRMRQANIESGEQPLSREEVLAELRDRRGGID